VLQRLDRQVIVGKRRGGPAEQRTRRLYVQPREVFRMPNDGTVLPGSPGRARLTCLRKRKSVARFEKDGKRQCTGAFNGEVGIGNDYEAVRGLRIPCGRPASN